MHALLSEAERARAVRYRQPGDVERFVKSRGALRRILSERIGADARALAFVEGGGRKPELRDHPAVHFNVSHSGAFALIAIGDAPLGVDIEQIKPDIGWRALAVTHMHPDERAVLASLPETQTRDAFFQFWTHKEAYLKATGIGLTDELPSIAVPLQGGPVAVPSTLPGGWHATPLDAPAGYRASIVTRDAPFRH